MNSRLLGQEGEVLTILKAVQSGDSAAVTECLDLGVPVDLTDEDGWSPVHHAIAHGQVEVIRLLMDRGCRIDPVKNTSLSANGEILKDGDSGGDIFDAARSGNIATVKGFLDLGVPVDLTDEDGWSPVHRAIAHGQVEVIRLLMDKGCRMVPVKEGILLDGNEIAAEGDIFEAAQLGHTVSVKAFLDVGVPVDLTDEDGWSPVHHAIAQGQVEVIRLLMDRGCCLVPVKNKAHIVRYVSASSVGEDIHVAQPGDTASQKMKDQLHSCMSVDRKRDKLPLESTVIFKAINATKVYDVFEAAHSGDTARVKWYIEQGVSVNLTDKDGSTLLHCAARDGQLEVVEYLVNAGCRIDPIDYNGWTSLICASSLGHVKVKHFLEQAREPIEYEHVFIVDRKPKGIEKGDVLLKRVVISIINNDIYTVKGFLNSGGSVHSTYEQRSLLNWASTFGQIEIMKLLLERGADVNTRDSTQERRTPLHRAAANGHVEAIKLLIEVGGDVYSFDNTRSTPFTRALANERHAAMEELARYDVNIVDERGLTALHRAAIDGGPKEAIVTLLKLGGKDSMTVVAGEQGTPLHQAVAEGSKDIVSLLLNEGCPLDLTDTRGVNPLHVAAEYGYTRIVELLLQKGCPLDLKTSIGKTVLHFAAIKGHTDLIDLFSQRGLDVNIADNLGSTPIHSAIKAGRPDSVYELQIVGGKNLPDAFGINLYDSIFICKRDFQLIRAYCCCVYGINFRSDCYIDINSTLSNNNLIDINRMLCLAAVSGNVDILDAMLQSSYPLDKQRMPKLIQFLSHNVYKGSIDSSLDDLFTCDHHEALNPLHLSMLIPKFGDWLDGAQRKYAARLISHPRTKHTIHELFPNGLSPLDVAHRFELHDIAGMIEIAGGRPGLWADLPKKVQQKSIECLMSLKSLRGGEFRGDLVSAILAMSGHRLVRDDQILCQKPEITQLEELSDIIKKKKKWKRVGRLLNLDEHTLNSLQIDSNESQSVNEAYYSMLKYWLEHGCNVTWKTLLDGIGRFETKKTMDDIRKKIEEICPVPGPTHISTSTFLGASHHIEGGDFPHRPRKPKPKPYPKASTRFPKFQCDPTLTKANLWRLVGRKMHSRWKEFAVHLHVETRITDVVYKQCLAIVEHCFKELTRRWLCGEEGTGDLPCTWETVFEALRLTGWPLLVEDVREALLQGKFSDDCY